MSLSTDQFLIGSSLLEHWPDAVDQCVAKIGGQSSNENLGFIYTTDSHADALDQILARLRVRTGISHWVGTTCIGILRTSHEEYQQPAITVMAGRFPEHAFRVFK